jgi:hypothetical protein
MSASSEPQFVKKWTCFRAISKEQALQIAPFLYREMM